MITITIEKLIMGGNGLARHEGKVVFIANVLPGEKIRAKVLEEKKDFVRAEVYEIIEASPLRILPPCPLTHKCGGCDWQHIEHSEQIKQKIAMTLDALKRTGGIDFPALQMISGQGFGYRNRIQFHRDANGNAGFLARSSHQMVPVQKCLVANPSFEKVFQKRVKAASLETSSFLKPSDNRFAAWTHSSENETFLIDEESEITGTASSPDALSEPGFSVPILDRRLFFDLRCFFQSNLEMVEKLIPYVLQDLHGHLALDLYCGVGLFGAFLKDKFQKILAVEENPVALNYAKKNIGGENVFLAGKLEDLVAQANTDLLQSRPNLILVDPPRPGLDEIVRQYLISQKPEKLIYVSCNPVTLARDLKILLAHGFKLDDLKLFDFYPQTAHVEAVAKLSPATKV